MNLVFQMSFIPQWRGIELLRSAVASMMEAGNLDSDLREAVAMVSIELMENGFKHGLCGDTPLKLALDIDDSNVVISVSNHFSAEATGNIEALNHTLAWIDTFDNPLDAYIQKMKMLYDQEDAGSSGLGLVRIVYEGQCQLSCDVDRENELLQVKAAFLPREEIQSR